MSNDNQPKRILRRPEVERLTGLCRSTIYLRMSQGTFPKSVPLGGRLIGWNSRSIENWVNERIANADEAA